MNLLKLRKVDKNFVVMAINSMGAILKDSANYNYKIQKLSEIMARTEQNCQNFIKAYLYAQVLCFLNEDGRLLKSDFNIVTLADELHKINPTFFSEWLDNKIKNNKHKIALLYKPINPNFDKFSLAKIDEKEEIWDTISYIKGMNNDTLKLQHLKLMTALDSCVLDS